MKHKRNSKTQTNTRDTAEHREHMKARETQKTQQNTVEHIKMEQILMMGAYMFNK